LGFSGLELNRGRGNVSETEKKRKKKELFTTPAVAPPSSTAGRRTSATGPPHLPIGEVVRKQREGESIRVV